MTNESFTTPKESNLITHAKQEFIACGWCDENMVYKDKIQEAVCKNILDLLQLFNDQIQTQTSAPYILKRFEQLANFEPLVPLTGQDNEWIEISNNNDGIRYQNKRCGRVFKKNDEAYDIEAKVFVTPNGSAYTSKDSKTTIQFPYMPKTEYIKVNE